MTQRQQTESRTEIARDQLQEETAGIGDGGSGHSGTGIPSPQGHPSPMKRLDDESTEISLLELVSVLLRRWKLVVGLPLIAALATTVLMLLLPPKYTATATFVPEIESSNLTLPSGIAGLAAQFGIAVPGGGSSSPAFYADVLQSRTLRDQVLLADYANPRTANADESASLLDILGIAGDNETERLEEGREELDESIAVRVDDETGVVSVSVETRYQSLSADVANQFIGLLNRFNLETRQSSAQERRQFIEGRLGEAAAELHAAEEALQGFLERNRQYQGSPDLIFQFERLQRQVTIKQEVLTTLRRQYEEARIQEVNDTQVITVIDRAVPPDQRSSPRRALSVALAFLLGGAVAVFGAFSLEFVERARSGGAEEFDEVASHWGSVKSEVRSIIDRVRHRKN